MGSYISPMQWLSSLVIICLLVVFVAITWCVRSTSFPIFLLSCDSECHWLHPIFAFFTFSGSPPPPAVRHMLFGFSSDELLCVFSYLWNLCKFRLGASGMTIVFARYHLVPLSSWLVLKSRANCSPVLSFIFSFILGFGSVLSSSGHLYWMYWASVFNGNFWVFFRLVFYWGILCIFGLCSLVLVTFIGCTRLVFYWHCGSFFPSLGRLY